MKHFTVATLAHRKKHFHRDNLRINRKWTISDLAAFNQVRHRLHSENKLDPKLKYYERLERAIRYNIVAQHYDRRDAVYRTHEDICNLMVISSCSAITRDKKYGTTWMSDHWLSTLDVYWRDHYNLFDQPVK